MVGDLPLSVLVNINEGVSGLHLGSIGSHGELIDTSITSPAISDGDVSLGDHSLGLKLEEIVEVVLDGVVVASGGVTDSGQKKRILGVTLGDNTRVKSGKSVIPQVEKGPNLSLGDLSRRRHGGDGARWQILGALGGNEDIIQVKNTVQRTGGDGLRGRLESRCESTGSSDSQGKGGKVGELHG